MRKINGVLAGLALVAAAMFGGAPQATAARVAADGAVVPAAFDYCYQQYMWCTQNDGLNCYAQYLICEEEAQPPCDPAGPPCPPHG